MENVLQIRNHLRLLFAMIANTTYNIVNQTIILDKGAGSVLTISLQNGSFNITELISKINLVAGPANYNFSYDKNMYTTTITSSSNFTLTMTDDIRKILGFSLLTYHLTGTVITSENAINMTRNNMLFVTIQEFGMNRMITNSQLDADFILPNLCNSGEFIVYQNDISSHDINRVLTRCSSQILTVQIRNENNQIFDNDNNSVYFI